MIELEDGATENKISKASACIKVLGVGGAGGNTVNSMIESQYPNIDFIVANTDAQALQLSKAPHKIQFGIKSTKGLGTGADPELGRRAAEEDLEKILQPLAGTDIVFLTAGMGGGTGSGALPVISRALKERGILSIAIVTKPFLFEGKKRMAVAEHTIELIKKDVDTLIVIPNQKLLEVVDSDVPMVKAFGMINEVLHQSVRGISDIIAKPGHINVDFADVRSIMKGMGYAVMGTGMASGENRAEEAARKSITSPLLENMSIKGAKGVLLNITGGLNLSLHEINQAANIIYEQVDAEANIILGSVIDENLTDEVYVTVIATGFNNEAKKEVTFNINSSWSKPEKVFEQAEETAVSIGDMQILSDEHEGIRLDFDDQGELLEEQKQEPAQIEHEEEKKVLEFKGYQEPSAIDTNDLDIPTFLRQKYSEDKTD